MTFSFSFQFHILGRVSQPSIPSWKADSIVHLNPWNSSTCFSDLLLTCNITSSGISDSLNKEAKNSQKQAQCNHCAIKSSSLIQMIIMSEGFLLKTPQKSCLLSPLELYLLIDGFSLLMKLTLASFVLNTKFFIYHSVAFLLISTLLAPAFISDRAFFR